MRLSARADYALRAAIELAAASDGHVTAEQLAQAQNIPGKFLETILTHLRRSNIVRSQRGPDGGFWLARPASEISLADIIRAIDGQLLGVRGERPENVSYPGAAEPLQRVWIALRANERAVLESVTLADIVAGRLPDAIAMLTDSPQAWVLVSDRHHIGDVADRADITEAVGHRGGRLRHLDRHAIGRNPQAWLAEGTGQNGLVLQLGEGEIVGYLAEHLRQRCVKCRADRREQLRGCFLTTALNL
jgi:Rrf2 family protein